ncbi:hypothetical protein HDU79_004320 [Rhizoclosmatium sp. JEL0117]|nr:hypothetical protein HDU79_004320 [Rhizoclosmatium sp. JEL0117]
MKKSVTASKSASSLLNAGAVTTTPLKEIASITNSHNDYDTEYIPRAIYNTEVDELLLREEGMSGRIQKHGKKNRSHSPAPQGSPRFNSFLLSQSNTPSISRNLSKNHSRAASANKSNVATPAGSDDEEEILADPNLAAVESRMVVLTELGINIITPAFLAIIPPLAKAHIANPHDEPLHFLGRHKDLPPTFPRTVRAATWKNTLAVSSQEIIDEARKTCATMINKNEKLAKEYTLCYEKPTKVARAERPTIRRSGLSFRGRGILEQRAEQGLIEGAGKRAPIETMYAKSIPTEMIFEAETNTFSNRRESSRESSGKKSRSNSTQMPVFSAVEFKSPLFSKVVETAEPETIEDSVVASPFGVMNEEADAWATVPASLVDNPFVQADLNKQASAKNSAGSLSSKKSPTNSDEWLAEERKKMNQDWGRESLSLASKKSVVERSEATQSSSASESHNELESSIPDNNVKQSDELQLEKSASTGKMADNFLKQFERPQSPLKVAPVSKEDDPVMNTFNSMVQGSIDLMGSQTSSESSSEPTTNSGMEASMMTQTSVIPLKSIHSAVSAFPGIEGLDEPNWGDVVSPSTGGTANNLSGNKSAPGSKHSLTQPITEMQPKSATGSRSSLENADRVSSKVASIAASKTSIQVQDRASVSSKNRISEMKDSNSKNDKDSLKETTVVEVETGKVNNTPSVSPLAQTSASTDVLSNKEAIKLNSTGIKSIPLSLQVSTEKLHQQDHHDAKHGFKASIKSISSGFKSIVGKMKNSSSQSLGTNEVLKSATPKGHESPRVSKAFDIVAQNSPIPNPASSASIQPIAVPEVQNIGLESVVSPKQSAESVYAQNVKNSMSETKLTPQPPSLKASMNQVAPDVSEQRSSVKLQSKLSSRKASIEKLPEKEVAPVAFDNNSSKRTSQELFKSKAVSQTREISSKPTSPKASVEEITPAGSVPAGFKVLVAPNSDSEAPHSILQPTNLTAGTNSQKSSVEQIAPAISPRASQIGKFSAEKTTELSSAPSKSSQPNSTKTSTEKLSLSMKDRVTEVALGANVGDLQTESKIGSQAIDSSAPAKLSANETPAQFKVSSRVSEIAARLSAVEPAKPSNSSKPSSQKSSSDHIASKQSSSIRNSQTIPSSNLNTAAIQPQKSEPAAKTISEPLRQQPQPPPSPSLNTKPRNSATKPIPPSDATKSTEPSKPKPKFMNAMDAMKQESAAAAAPSTANSKPEAETAKDLWTGHKGVFHTGSNTNLLGPAEKEKKRMEEAASKAAEVAAMTSGMEPALGQVASVGVLEEGKSKKKSDGAGEVKKPSSEDMAGRAVCEKVKCEVRVDNSVVTCIDDKKREVFPALELHRVVKAENTPGRPEVTLHACVPRDKGKAGSKFRDIVIQFDGGPSKAKAWAENLMVLVYGAVTPEKAVMRKVLCLVDRFDKEPQKMIEKYMKPIWVVFNKPVEVKNVQFMELSVNNSIADEEWHNISNVVVMNAEFTPRMLQILVKNGYADEPVDLQVDEDPVDAALAILKSAIGHTKSRTIHVTGFMPKREEGKIAGFFKGKFGK